VLLVNPLILSPAGSGAFFEAFIFRKLKSHSTNHASHRWHTEAVGSSIQIRSVSPRWCRYRTTAKSASRIVRTIQMLTRIRAGQPPVFPFRERLATGRPYLCFHFARSTIRRISALESTLSMSLKWAKISRVVSRLISSSLKRSSRLTSARFLADSCGGFLARGMGIG
jgi:hypothetical protein